MFNTVFIHQTNKSSVLFLAYEFSVLTPWRQSRLDYVFDLQGEKIIHADYLEQHDKIGKMKACGRGGILADEMGLGKTSESACVDNNIA
jgi:SNF2 family DNA or RNA helicase